MSHTGGDANNDQTTRTQGIRKSRFPAQSTIPSDATFDFVSSGHNIKISVADLLTALGVTGTLVQDGDVTGTPILDVDGSVNKIRNLEAGAGIKTSVSGDNGATIASGLKQTATNTQIFDDLTIAEPTAASLKEGFGIGLSKANNIITIAVEGSLASLNRVLVQQASDLSGTLDSTKEYFIDGIIDMGTQEVEVPQGGLSLSGYNFDLSKLISSANNYTMFTSPASGSGNLLGQDYSVEVTGTNSQVYNLVSDTGNEAFEFSRINYNDCTSLGTIDNYRQGLEVGTGRFGGSPALILKGIWLGGYFIDTSIVRSLDVGMTGALFEAGAGFAMSSRFRSNQNIDLPASASFVDFAPSNFPNASTLQFDGVIITRDGVSDASDSNYTPNITAADLPSSWISNQGMNNTFVGGNLNVTVETATVIAGTSTFVDLAGTFTPSDLQHFSEPSNGQLMHNGDNPREFRLIGSFSIEGPANDDVALKVVKWDDSASSFIDVYTQTREINALVGATNLGFYDIATGVTLDKNDFVKMQIANNSTTGNLTAKIDSFFTVLER